jgi:hypothetical protein
LNGSARRNWTCYLLALALAVGCVNVAGAQRGLRPGQLIELKAQLVTGLRPRLPSEFRYIDDVVDQVEIGALPETLVRSTFGYARKKRPYPIQYFDRALRIRAKQRGINRVPILKIEIQ